MSSQAEIQLAKENSAQVFRDHVWPLWREHLQGTEIQSVEDRPDRLSRLFDSFGIDGFYIKTTTGAPIPVASRVEFKEKEPRFTLRYRFWDHRAGEESGDCEFQRKVIALADPESRRYMPYYTIQSAFVDGAVLHSLLVRTERLIEFARDNEERIAKRGFPTRFMHIPVGDLVTAGIAVLIKP